jgi:hypothetical protein
MASWDTDSSGYRAPRTNTTVSSSRPRLDMAVSTPSRLRVRHQARPGSASQQLLVKRSNGSSPTNGHAAVDHRQRTVGKHQVVRWIRSDAMSERNRSGIT